MSEGWICLHRGWRENPIFKGEFSRADAWVWLIESACWKASRARIKGEAVDLQRGELTFSQRFLADKWGWSKSRVDRFIADLRAEGMIETRSKNEATAGHSAGQGQSIISICNYAKYQDVSDTKRGNVEPDNGATAGQRRGKEEQGNKGTSIEEEDKSSPSKRASVTKSPTKVRMTDDWKPAPLPASVSELTNQWPPGRLEREVEQFRDYWLDRTDKRPGWDRTFHNRIRDIHDRILRESRNDQSRNMGNNPRRGSPRDGVAAALDRDLGFDQSPGPFGRRDAGDGSGNSVRAIAPPRAVW